MTRSEAKRHENSIDPAVRAEAARVLAAAKARASRVRPKRAPGIAKKAAKKAGKRKAEHAVYEAVRERDAGFCTVSLPASLIGACRGALQIDHQWGRGKAPTLLTNCRLLCEEHHRRKTDSETEDGNSRIPWLIDFQTHAVRHEYWSEAAKAETTIALERAQHPETTR